VQFTIRAEKCPNRKGVEALLRHYQGEVLGFDKALQQAASGGIKTLYLVGGYREPWITPEQAEGLKGLTTLIVQDLLPSPASALAHLVLPGGSFAEKDGTFVNHAGLAQAIHRAIQSPGDAWPDGRILMELTERRGLFHAPSLRQELAKEVPYFAALATGDLGDYGVRLAGAKAR
jgi:NADH-quinone oxidoreductase subunit G